MHGEMVLIDENTPNRTTNDLPLIEETTEHYDTKESCSTLSEEDHEVLTEAQKAFAKSRSPMQEAVLLEQRWQGHIHELDGILASNGEGYFSQSSFYVIFSKETTLTILFKLFDWEDTGSISQEKFVDCVRNTLREPGSQEFVDLVDVLAFVICGEDNHIKEADFHRIFKSKGVLVKLFKIISKDCDGLVTRSIIMDLIANLTYAKPREKYTKEQLEQLEGIFRETLGTKNELTFDDFKKIMHSKNLFFSERVFHVFDRDKSGSVSLSEFLDAMHQFTGKSPNDKLQFLFRIYDLDGDGLVQRDEMEKVMKACMEENGMTFSDEQLIDLTSALFEDADKDNRGVLSFEDLEAQIAKHDGLLENLSISIDRWLLPPTENKKKDKPKFYLPHQLTLPYLKNNYVYVIFISFFIGINVGLFVDRALSVAAEEDNPLVNNYYIFARASGQCLNFNCAFILVLVLRRSLTYLRSHGASAFLPLDQSIYLHKMCGFVVLFHSLLHTIMHLINFNTVVVHNEDINKYSLTAAEWLLTSKPGAFGLVQGWANPTGIILIIVLIIMVTCSLPYVRKSGYFEVFYWTHLLYVIFFILTILHAPHFWKWFIVPGLIFVTEKLFRYFEMNMSGYRKTYISSGILLPSKVTHLVIRKPQGFHFHPGDYVFVNIPTIAKYEWHPITISSAPEQEDAVWLHIRAVGQWTNRLFEYFQEQQKLYEKSAPRALQNVVRQSIKINIETTAHENTPDEMTDTKNGVVNLSFEPDILEVKQDESDIEPKVNEDSDEGNNAKDIGLSNTTRGKRDVGKAISVPDFDRKMKKRENNRMIRSYFRSNSTTSIDLSEMREAERASNFSGNEMLFPMNRSVAQSIKYMRKKPRVVTLDLPEDVSGTEDDEALGIEEVSSDPAINLETGERRQGVNRRSVLQYAGERIFSTKKRKPIDDESSRVKRQSRLKEAEVFGQCTVGKPLVIYLEGAYGAPSSHIFRAQHAVLIGTGIGVTPFASILQSIMHRYLKASQTCPKCCHEWSADIPQSVMNLRKVDFFWINRDQRSFEWFVNLLSQLEIEQVEKGGVLERFLDMHMYITSALQKTDMKAVGLQLALDLLHEKEKRDLVTGLKTRTNAGRPNWNKVFKQLHNQKKGKITVFYCGPPALGRLLKYKCAEHGFEFRKEVF